MKMPNAIVLPVVLICWLVIVGCKQQTATKPANGQPPSQTSDDDDDHEHALSEGVRDHSVAGHAHGVGPHDGTVADWGGGKYHPEFTVDHEKQAATVYILGSDEKTPTPIPPTEIELSIRDPAMQVTLNAAPQEGDPEGMASRYIGKHEKLGMVQEYAGTITALIDGTPYSGDFAEQAHGDEEQPQ